LGAFCIRRSKAEKTLFDSLQGIIVFVMFGVLLPSVLKSFLNPLATLQTGEESNYWMLWMTRLSSNITSNLMLIPLIVILWRNGISWLRSGKLARCIEACLLLAVTMGISLLIFGGNAADSILAVIYVPLPLLFWAAVRFGVGGLSASLLGIALISIWNTIHGRGPFETSSMVHAILIQRVLFLHGLLTVFGFPLTLIAGLIAERHRDEETRSRMIYAQEQERYHIGRALHEDITQSLTLAGLSIDELRVRYDAAATPPLDRLYNQISDASATALRLSHRVYPFMVEYLGLSAALRKLCWETDTESPMTMNCFIEEMPTELPSDVSHRLFRVAQEALQDIVQHSHAKTVALELRIGDGRILLRITHDGVSMDPQGDDGTRMIYMREQVLSLQGTFKIMSTPTKGTVIEVSAPIKTSP
jgi:signal transduction histidine kinase